MRTTKNDDPLERLAKANREITARVEGLIAKLRGPQGRVLRKQAPAMDLKTARQVLAAVNSQVCAKALVLASDPLIPRSSDQLVPLVRSELTTQLTKGGGFDTALDRAAQVVRTQVLRGEA